MLTTHQNVIVAYALFSGAAKRATDNYSGRIEHQINARTMPPTRISRANLSTWQNPATFGESNIANPGFSLKPQHHPMCSGKLPDRFRHRCSANSFSPGPGDSIKASACPTVSIPRNRIPLLSGG